MPAQITANVIPEHGSEFEAELANLAPNSVFIKAASGLEFREAVTVKFGGVTVHGEVAFVCRAPAGAVVVFSATPEAMNTIEDLMEGAEVVMGADAPPPVVWEDQTSSGDDDSDPEDPTNPALEKPAEVPVHVEERIYATSETHEEAEVRRAFMRTLPPNYATEPMNVEHIPGLDSVREPPTVDVPDADSTLVPEERARARARTVVAELETTDHGLEAVDDSEVTNNGRGDFDESTEYP